MVCVVAVDLKHDGHKKIYYEERHLDYAEDPEKEHVKTSGPAVDMKQYQVDDPDTDDKVIHVKVCITDHEDSAVAGTRHAVALENVDIGNAVEH